MTKLDKSNSILLDAVRYGLAAVVVIGHGFNFFLGDLGGFFQEKFPHLQSIAVVGFFYMSGFLIVGSQLRHTEKGEASLTRYLFDRFSRIYITLIPSLIFVAISDYFSGQEKNSAIFSSLTLNALLIPSMQFGTLKPIWSLMYEWWIYILFGGVYFFRTKKILASLLIVIGAYYTFIVNARGEAGNLWIVWLFGGICAYMQDKMSWSGENAAKLDKFGMALLTGACWLFYESNDAYNVGADILLAGAIFIFTSRKFKNPQWLLKYEVIWRYLAGFSFTLFLTHYTVLSVAKINFGLSGWTGLIVGFVMSHLVAIALASVTELKLSQAKKSLQKIWQSISGVSA